MALGDHFNMIKSSIHTSYSQALSLPRDVFDFDSLVLLSLSVLSARKFFRRMYFFGDDLSLSIVRDELKLPFDFASSELQYALPKPLAKYWSLAKLKSASLVYEPFLHIDNDVVLHKPLPDKLLSGACAMQSPYEDSLLKAKSTLPFVSDIAERNIDTKRFYNAGLMGGNDLQLFPDIFLNSMDIVSKAANRSVLYSDGNPNKAMHNQFLEEFMIGVFCRERGIPVETLFPSAPTEEEAKELGYTHLAGNMKHEPKWILRARSRLFSSYHDAWLEVDRVAKKYGLVKRSI